MTKAEKENMATKILERQMSAIDAFGYLKHIELCRFIAKGYEKPSLFEVYFQRSRGWANDTEWAQVSQELAKFIKSAIKVKLKSPPKV